MKEAQKKEVVNDTIQEVETNKQKPNKRHPK